MRGRPACGGIQQLPLINAGAGQQVLHPVRPRVPGGLGQRPAVVILQLRQHPVHHVAAGQPRLAAGKARRYPGHQVIEQVLVRIIVYRGISGCRVIVLFHKPAGSRQPRQLSCVSVHVAAVPGQHDAPRGTAVTCNDAPQITNYNCRSRKTATLQIAVLSEDRDNGQL